MIKKNLKEWISILHDYKFMILFYQKRSAVKIVIESLVIRFFMIVMIYYYKQRYK